MHSNSNIFMQNCLLTTQVNRQYQQNYIPSIMHFAGSPSTANRTLVRLSAADGRFSGCAYCGHYLGYNFNSFLIFLIILVFKLSLKFLI
nr:MAG TPA: hypothetical protein [Caudoviricetes sp.]